jgi:MFS family permease
MKGVGRLNKLKQVATVYSGLPSYIYVIFFARIVNALVSFVGPFMTLLLTVKLGYTPEQSGFFVMLSASASVPGMMLGGKLADRVGRKRVFAVATILGALTLIPCAITLNSMLPWLLVAYRFFMAIGGPAHVAMITDLTNANNRKASFSLLYLGNNLGFAIGPIAAGFLFRNYIQWAFWGDAITTLLSVCLVLAVVPETLPGGKKKEAVREDTLLASEHAEQGGVFRALLRRPVLVAGASLMLAYSFVYSQHSFTLPLQLDQLYGEAAGARLYGFMMSTNGIVVVLLTSMVTAWTLKVRPTVSMGFGGILYALGFGMIYLVHTPLAFILSAVVWSTGEVFVSTHSGVFVANNSPVSHRGRFGALIDTVRGAGTALSPFIVGKWLKVAPMSSVWLVSFFIAGAAAVMMCMLPDAFPARKRTPEIDRSAGV